MRSIRFAVFFLAAFGAGLSDADAQELMPAATVNLNSFVALREIAADAVVSEGRVVLLIRDQGLTGRSAILLEVDGEGGNPRWTDLKEPADSVVMVGNSVAAVARMRDGVRLLGPAGITAPHVLAMAASLSGGTYAFLPLGGERAAVVERSSGNLKLLDLKSGKVELTADLGGEDIARGRAMYAYHLDKIRARGETPPNPRVIVSAASNPAGELFLLTGPVAFAEGVRVVRAGLNGKVTGTLRLALPGFRPEYGSPNFLGVSGDRLYLITSRGWMNIYRIPNGELAQSLEKGR
ncbi:MAG: hypothetical protein IT167_11140 [Bryobacterales bacterium]|nr:hypothetical protein [Bryobacterales bacterium]